MPGHRLLLLLVPGLLLPGVPLAVAGSGSAMSPPAVSGSVSGPVAGAARKPAPAGSHRLYGRWYSSRIGGGGYLQQVVFAPASARVPQRLYLSSDVGGLFRSDDGGATWRMLHDALPADGDNYSVRGLIVDPRDPDRVLIATDNGIWCSADAGRTWQKRLDARFAGNGPHRADGRILVADPANPDRILAAPLGAAAIGTVVHISTDGGATWAATAPVAASPAASPLPVLAPVDLLVDPADPQRFWLSARRSRIWISPREHTFDGGLWRTDDAGATWQKLSSIGMKEIIRHPAPPASSGASGLLIALTPATDRVVRSTDLGRTWQPLDAGLAPYSTHYRTDGSYGALATDPSGGLVLLGGNGASIYRLSPDATRWEKIPWQKENIHEGDWWGALSRHGYPHFGSALGHLAIDPADPRHWTLTDWYAFYQTRDAGRSWKLDIEGIEMTVVHTLAQDPADPARIHAGLADIGYLRSTDAADTFVPVHNAGISNNIKSLAVSPARPGRIYAVGPREADWFANQVFVTDDAGATWHRSPMRGLPRMEGGQHRCHSIALHPHHPDEAWLAVSGPVGPSAGGIYRTADAGETWTQAGEGLPTGVPLFRSEIWVAGPEIAVSSDGSVLAASDDRARVFRLETAPSSPSPAVWREVPAAAFASPDGAPSGGVNALFADPSTPGRFYLCRKEGGLWRTDDAGLAWNRISSMNTWTLAIDAGNPARLALNGADGIRFSTDGGVTWTRLDAGLPYRHPRNVLAFAGSRLVVGTGGNGIFRTDLLSPE
ncbi:hypothetical protein OPIT5_09895 [Opitutaceae bacterium TAV5]|nr:hypothetical protein OPIT5_09895 [Opitutaceae bacterium TAV5]